MTQELTCWTDFGSSQNEGVDSPSRASSLEGMRTFLPWPVTARALHVRIFVPVPYAWFVNGCGRNRCCMLAIQDVFPHDAVVPCSLKKEVRFRHGRDRCIEECCHGESASLCVSSGVFCDQ